MYTSWYPASVSDRAILLLLIANKLSLYTLHKIIFTLISVFENWKHGYSLLYKLIKLFFIITIILNFVICPFCIICIKLCCRFVKANWNFILSTNGCVNYYSLGSLIFHFLNKLKGIEKNDIFFFNLIILE